MKTVLLTHRYFWPDTAPYGLILKELVNELGNTIDVRVFSTNPSYSKNAKSTLNSSSDSNAVTRITTLDEQTFGLPGRIVNAVWYSVRLFAHIIRHRPSLVTASTFPPVLAALSAVLACKFIRSRFAYVLMDVYPDVVYLGKKPNLAYKTLAALDNLTLRLADHIIVLSEDMKRTLVRRGIRTENIRAIPNIELGKPETTSTKSSLPTFDTSRLTIAFCGNIGNFQGLSTFRCVVKTLCQRGVARFIFMGDGKYKSELVQFFNDRAVEHVHFLSRMPVETARSMMTTADLNLVSLSPGVSDCSFPSKASTICSVSGPLLVYDNPQSQLRQLVTEYGAGITGDHTQHDEIVQEITELHANRGRLNQFREGSSNLYDAHFKRARIVSAWRQIFTESTKNYGVDSERFKQ